MPLKARLLKVLLKGSGISRRLLPQGPDRPVFVIGFNNSGKSMIVDGLGRHPGLKPFPGEGNDVLWFDGFYPWTKSQPPPPPLFLSPHTFMDALLKADPQRLERARERLALYAAVRGRGRRVVNDSGMLAALDPRFQEAQLHRHGYLEGSR